MPNARPFVSLTDRRARVGRLHHLGAGGPDMVTVAGDLVGLHGTDPATVYLSLAARVRTCDIGGVDAAMYDDRSLVRLLGMRRTVFTAPRHLARVIQTSAAMALLPNERRTFGKMLVEGQATNEPESWIDRVSANAAVVLARHGELAATEFAPHLPEFGLQLRLNVGKKYEGSIGVSSKILFLMGIEGRVVRTRPKGSWISSQYRWDLTESWLGETLDGQPFEGLAPADAERQLVERYLHSYGPATTADVRWWTGWSLGKIRSAMADLAVTEVEIEDGGTATMLTADVEPTLAAPLTDPWVRLLPSLDPTAMGWKERDWYLGPYREPLFDYSGNIGPTVWCDGRIVGGWSQTPTGEVVTHVLEDVGAEASNAVAAEAVRIQRWIGLARVSPRFPTPLQKALANGNGWRP